MDLEDVIEFGSVTVRSHSPERCSIAVVSPSVLVLMVSPALTLRRLVAQCLNEATGKTILNCLKAGAK